jgi:hypothetical protein
VPDVERSDEPQTPLGFILAEAIELIERLCEEGSIEQPRGIITLIAASVPGTEYDSEIAAYGFDDASEVVIDLARHLEAAARSFGLQVHVHRLHGGPAS